ncbi:MAG: DUF6703 family protein [Labedaea sp.]
MRARRSSRTPLIAGDGPLAKVPPVAAFVVVIALFTTAVVVRGGVGALLLGVLAVGVGVLLAATWPALSSSARAGRVVVLAVLLAVGLSMLLTR